jgi:hypothetical protein
VVAYGRAHVGGEKSGVEIMLEGFARPNEIFVKVGCVKSGRENKVMWDVRLIFLNG